MSSSYALAFVALLFLMLIGICGSIAGTILLIVFAAKKKKIVAPLIILIVSVILLIISIILISGMLSA